jgi:hypothetical protein
MENQTPSERLYQETNDVLNEQSKRLVVFSKGSNKKISYWIPEVTSQTFLLNVLDLSGEITWSANSDTKTSKFVIYGLVDPFTKKLRYIGKSTKGLRRARELHSAKCKSWIISVLNNFLVPIIVIFEQIDENDENAFRLLNESEIRWIAKGRIDGADLTNICDGGSGTNGFKWNEEQKRRISEIHTGRKRSLETGMRISASKIGKKRGPPSKEQCEKQRVSMLGKNTGPKSEDTKRKISESLKNRKYVGRKKPSGEALERIRKAQRKRRERERKEKEDVVLQSR